jgi:hypothetical protein
MITADTSNLIDKSLANLHGELLPVFVDCNLSFHRSLLVLHRA